MQLVRGLEVHDESKPRVVQEVPRRVALAQDAEGDARKQGPRRKPRHRQQGFRDRGGHARTRVAVVWHAAPAETAGPKNSKSKHVCR